MRAEEIREMADPDIRSRIAELEEERFRLRFRAATETLEDPLRLRAIRKDVARLKTVLRERELTAASEAPGGERPRRRTRKRRRERAERARGTGAGPQGRAGEPAPR